MLKSFVAGKSLDPEDIESVRNDRAERLASAKRAILGAMNDSHEARLLFAVFWSAVEDIGAGSVPERADAILYLSQPTISHLSRIGVDTTWAREQLFSRGVFDGR